MEKWEEVWGFGADAVCVDGLSQNHNKASLFYENQVQRQAFADPLNQQKIPYKVGR